MKFPAAAHFFTAALLASAAAQQDLGLPPQDAGSPPQVRIELLVARLPEARAAGLRAELSDPAKSSAAQDKLLAMIAKKEAELVDWPILTIQSAQTGQAVNVHELRYASEYGNAPFPAPQHGDGPANVAEPKAPDNAAKDQPAGAAMRGQTDSSVAPTSFEKRDLGVTLEAEPEVSPDGMTVRLNIAASHVTLLGWTKATAESTKLGKITVEQPKFQTLKSKTDITIQSGRPVLLGFHKLQEPPKTVELFIVTATVLKPTPASEPEQTLREKQR